jgi:hypothetical protein
VRPRARQRDGLGYVAELAQVVLVDSAVVDVAWLVGEPDRNDR